MLLLGLLACGGPDAAITAPADGATVHSAWVPLVVSLPPGRVGQPVTVHLDGQDVTDPLGLSREREPWLGGGGDYLATLDLVDVPPGPHVLEVAVGTWPGRRTVRSTFDFDPPPIRLLARLTGEDGAPASGRVLVLDAEGPVNLASVSADHLARDAFQSSFHVIDGAGVAFLEPGAHTLVAWGGLRQEVDVLQVDLTEDTEVDLVLRTAVPTPGELAADLHVHTGRSRDAWVPDRVRYESLVAADLDVVVITDHDTITDPSEALAGRLHHVLGAESTIRLRDEEEGAWDAAGHLNAFPLSKGDLPRFRVHQVAELLGAFRERDPGVLLQLNHPRGIHFHPEDPPTRFWPLLRHNGFDHEVAPGEGDNAWMSQVDPVTGASSMDFDAVEVFNRFSMPLYREVRADWFALLDHGVVLTGTGNSDSHGLAVELVGMTASFVRADREGFVEGIRAGRVRVSTGPFVDLSIAGQGPGALVAAEDGRVTATVTVEAAAWVPTREVRLVVGGEVVRTGTGTGTFTWRVDVPRDTWVLAEAGFPLDETPSAEELGLYGLLAPGYTPLGFTNPIRVDADGDGAWTPPGR